MSAYAITFRISSETRTLGTYQERYDSLVEAIKKQAKGRNYWVETTSFALIESDQTSAANLADAIDKDSKVAPLVDLVVVINLSHKGYKIIGPYSDKDIDAIMALR